MKYIKIPQTCQQEVTESPSKNAGIGTRQDFHHGFSWQSKSIGTEAKSLVFFQTVFPLDNRASYFSSVLCLISIWHGVGIFSPKLQTYILVDEKQAYMR